MLLVGACKNPLPTPKYKCVSTAIAPLEAKQLSLNDVITHQLTIGKKTADSVVATTISDCVFLNKYIFDYPLLPATQLVGTQFKGNVIYALDSAELISAAFFVPENSEKIYAWPDKLAKKSKNKISEDNKPRFVKRLNYMKFHTLSAQKQFADNKNFEQLELLHPKSIYTLGENNCEQSKMRFDLSGFCSRNDSIFAIADKMWTTDIYSIDTASNGKFYIKLVHKGPDYKTKDCDIEAIDIYKGKFMVAEETNNIIYYENAKGKFDIFPSDFKSLGEDMELWGIANTGVEGFACDSQNDIIYFTKEREPRRIYVYDVKQKKFSTPFDDVVLPDDGDISDCHYENGYLYFIDRANCLVRRINVTTKESKSYSFRKYSNNGKKHIYTADFGMAEALLLTKDAIFVGMDNNGDIVSSYGEEIGLPKHSTSPSIFAFKRPEGF